MNIFLGEVQPSQGDWRLGEYLEFYCEQNWGNITIKFPLSFSRTRLTHLTECYSLRSGFIVTHHKVSTLYSLLVYTGCL